MLTDKIRLSGPDSNDPEDILSSSLGVIFPDDITNQHGDGENSVIYLSPRFGPIHLGLADPQGDDNRRLFSHFLWNASLQLAEFVEDAPAQWPVADQRVLELGAGTALAGIVAALMGAREVVVSDYPAPEVLVHIKANVKRNIEPRRKEVEGIGEVRVEGHEWGVLSDGFSRENKESFGRLLVADCLWMPWQHTNLLKSIRWFLAEEGRAWVVAGFHTGREKMRGFYEEEALAEAGLEVERIWERNADGREREWVWDRGIEDVTARKRWLVVAILRRRKGCTIP
jgi:predicted nicotinamide N-methyase